MQQAQMSRDEIRSEILKFIIFRWVLFALGSWAGVYISSMFFYIPIQGEFSQAIYALVWSIPLSFIVGLIFSLSMMAIRNKQPKIKNINTANQEPIPHFLNAINSNDFHGLYMGQSHGLLASRGHASSITANTDVVLSGEDCSKNIIAFGGTGGGKTSRTINPLLLQIFTQDASALIFDIKTDFHKEVDALTSRTNRQYKVVGDGGMTLNLFRGCTPELASSYLKSCFSAQGQGENSSFWVDSATELCRHSLTLLMLLRPDSYSIAGLHDIVFDENDRNNLLINGAENIGKMSDREQRFFTQSQYYFVNKWNGYSDKIKQDIVATVNVVLSPFAHPDLVDAFSDGSTQGEADMTELVNERSVFLVNLPMTKYGKEGARFAYLIIKLRFMNMMRERKNQSSWNQTRPVAFVCDEYQAIIDSISDTDFWDKSRSTKTVGLVSMQGVSSLIHALKDEKTANTILQNFRQRIFYRTEDEATLQHIKGVLGQVDVELTSHSQSSSQSDSFSQNAKQGRSRSFSENDSTSESIQKYDLFGANDMRNLSADFCLFIGNIGDSAADDVLRVDPLYV